MIRAIFHIARGDFLERVRRYSFLVTLLFAVYLGYAAATGKMLCGSASTAAFTLQHGLARPWPWWPPASFPWLASIS